MFAEKHPENEERLQALRFYDVLDTEAEADFDDIVSLASKICDTPVSLISLVDDNRQWFKAKVGFDEPETSLRESVCSHAILGDGIVEIPDMAQDPRTRDNPLHKDSPKVAFYAGANLVTPEGLPIGTLCVLDTKPRRLTAFQREALQTLSRQVVVQLELRKKVKEAAALRSEIDHRVANSLQTLASIMRVSYRHVTDSEALAVLKSVESRLSAVASLHTELMRGNGQPVVSGRMYLGRVSQLLQESGPEGVRIALECDEVDITSAAASALGMIASEFVANSIKYAFPGGRAGTVQLGLCRVSETTLEFSCSDDGVGSEANRSQETVGSGLGASLMTAASAQLEAALTHEIGTEGARLSIVFENRAAL